MTDRKYRAEEADEAAGNSRRCRHSSSSTFGASGMWRSRHRDAGSNGRTDGDAGTHGDGG